jgi:hypothetical protein
MKRKDRQIIPPCSFQLGAVAVQPGYAPNIGKRDVPFSVRTESWPSIGLEEKAARRLSRQAASFSEMRPALLLPRS